MNEEVQETACLNPGFCSPPCVACEADAREYHQMLMAPPSAAVAAYIRERLRSGTMPVRKVRRRSCPEAGPEPKG